MAVYKIERCRQCNYKHNEPKPAKNKPCPKCGTLMYYLENWNISYQVEGIKYIESVSPSRKESEAALAKRRTQIRENRFFDIKKDVTWEDACKKLRASYPKIRSAKTIRGYDNSIDRLEDAGFSRHRLTDSDFIDIIDEHISARQDAGRANATINKELGTIKRMAKLCKLYDLFNEIELLPLDNERTRFLTEAEQETLLGECQSNTLRLAILIALNTGLRANGVYHMEWSDIDFQNKSISRIVKGNKRVSIPMTDRLAAALKQHRKEIILSKWVFPSPSKPGEPIRDDNRRPFYNACTRAKITDFRFHDLRHTFATWFLYRTRDKRALQEILGHTDSRMTDRYAHILDEHKREAMQKFADGGK